MALHCLFSFTSLIPSFWYVWSVTKRIYIYVCVRTCRVWNCKYCAKLPIFDWRMLVKKKRRNLMKWRRKMCREKKKWIFFLFIFYGLHNTFLLWRFLLISFLIFVYFFSVLFVLFFGSFFQFCLLVCTIRSKVYHRDLNQKPITEEYTLAFQLYQTIWFFAQCT